jgi:phage host-nuclease inhibitor protein Gam
VTKTIKGARLKRAAETAAVPQNMDQAAEMVARMGAIERELTVAATALAEEVAQAKNKAEASAAPLKAELEMLGRGVHLWAEANRETLTDGGRRKTVRLATGEIAWRALPPSVKLRDTNAVMEALRAHQLGKFIREKFEIDREAMLREPALAATVPGVTIASGVEEFVVTPTQAQLDGRAA